MTVYCVLKAQTKKTQKNWESTPTSSQRENRQKIYRKSSKTDCFSIWCVCEWDWVVYGLLCVQLLDLFIHFCLHTVSLLLYWWITLSNRFYPIFFFFYCIGVADSRRGFVSRFFFLLPLFLSFILWIWKVSEIFHKDFIFSTISLLFFCVWRFVFVCIHDIFKTYLLHIAWIHTLRCGR